MSSRQKPKAALMLLIAVVLLALCICAGGLTAGLFGRDESAGRPPQAQQWDKMWAMWENGEAAPPYAQLMTYQSEVNNGGHSQYFFNTANTADLQAEADALLSVLPEPLRGNLQRAYEAFAAQEDIADDANDALFEACDDVFHQHESLINGLLEAYAQTLE